MSPLGLVHTVLAVVALGAGLLIFTIAKGTRVHRVIGYVYVVAMLGLNITALMIYRLFDGFGPFHVAAVFSLVTLIGGYLPARLKQPRHEWLYRHYAWISGSYIGLVAALASELLTRLPMFDGLGAMFGLAVGAASAAVIITGFLILFRKREAVIREVMGRIVK